MADTPRQARIITSLNLKGGVGKTHVCWLIAGVCQERGKRCLVLDLDKQGNITTSLLPSFTTGTGTDAFFNPAIDPQISDLIQRSTFSSIDIIPGGFALERFNDTDPARWEASGLVPSLVDPLASVRGLYDYVMIDCPADISLITYAALAASDYLVVPLEVVQWGALGTHHVIKAYEHVRRQHNRRLELLGYVVSRCRLGRKYQSAYVEKLRHYFGDNVFETVIPDLAQFEQSVNDRLPITLHSPRSNAASIARSFFNEVESRAERIAGRGRQVGGRRVHDPIGAVAQ
jgi:chromosome partitioning protein